MVDVHQHHDIGVKLGKKARGGLDRVSAAGRAASLAWQVRGRLVHQRVGVPFLAEAWKFDSTAPWLESESVHIKSTIVHAGLFVFGKPVGLEQLRLAQKLGLKSQHVFEAFVREASWQRAFGYTAQKLKADR
jgi:hypothetical protein